MDQHQQRCVCRGLEEFGVRLFGAADPEFFPRVEVLRKCWQARGIPPEPHPDVSFPTEQQLAYSAVMVNDSDQPIVGYTLQVQCALDGRICFTYTLTGESSAVFFFGGLCGESLRDRRNERALFDNSIFPQSQRLWYRRHIVGDNSDVAIRPPREGCIISLGASDDQRGEPISYVLDGVFFADGSFAGPDEWGLWDEVVEYFRIRQELATTALAVQEVGGSIAQIYEALLAVAQPYVRAAEQLPPPPPPPFPTERSPMADHARTQARRLIGRRFLPAFPGLQTPEQAVSMVMRWTHSSPPVFRRLDRR